MPKQILVIVDGSDTSNYAVDSSITLALEVGGHITFCVTVDPDLFGDGVGVLSLAELALGRCQQMLNDATERAHNRGCNSVTGRILREDPVAAVVRVAKEDHSDFIMMGLAPRVGILRPFMRSLAERILRETDIPLCAMRRPARKKLSRRILVPLVNDETTEVAVDHAISLAVTLKATLVFCTVETNKSVGDCPTLDAAKTAANARGVQAEELLLPSEDGVPQTIAHIAHISACDAIIMASHMRQGWPRIIEGSVTGAVIYASDVPVIVVRKALDMRT
jgi:nucleotide-binding universal stress UspA family protein